MAARMFLEETNDDQTRLESAERLACLACLLLLFSLPTFDTRISRHSSNALLTENHISLPGTEGYSGVISVPCSTPRMRSAGPVIHWDPRGKAVRLLRCSFLPERLSIPEEMRSLKLMFAPPFVFTPPALRTIPCSGLPFIIYQTCAVSRVHHANFDHLIVPRQFPNDIQCWVLPPYALLKGTVWLVTWRYECYGRPLGYC